MLLSAFKDTFGKKRHKSDSCRGAKSVCLCVCVRKKRCFQETSNQCDSGRDLAPKTSRQPTWRIYLTPELCTNYFLRSCISSSCLHCNVKPLSLREDAEIHLWGNKNTGLTSMKNGQSKLCIKAPGDAQTTQSLTFHPDSFSLIQRAYF